MNREIRFRAWLPAIKLMTYGHTIEDLMTWNNGKSVESKTAQWLQFTGLRDKNGTEIHESDIVKITHMGSHGVYTTNEEVRFQDGVFEIDDHELLRSVHDMSEVVGNIFENANLLACDG